MRKKTHDEYVLELANKNPNIEVVDHYVGANNNILHRCKICGHKWSPKPSLLLMGFGCPQCNHQKMTKTQKQYIDELYSKNPNISVVGKYVNYHTKVIHRCNVCEYEWSAQPADILRGRGCPRCVNHIKLTQEDFIKKVREVHPTIRVIGEYKNSDSPVKVECLRDGWIWEPVATNLIHGERGCPKCKQSHGESQIEKYLKKYNINFIPQYTFEDCRNIKPLPFDFYLSDLNVCIEYDGIQHFKPVDAFGGQVAFERTIKHDSIKTNYCLSNNIVLIRIKYNQDIEIELNNFFNNIQLIKEAI